ncbi:MAG: ketoacyl-ACP synthase III [Acidobacteriota bacterium]|nr:ketoacyl-ACP synthase III [Acidobacteriota bacterium]
MHAAISAIECYFPEQTLTTADLAAEFPDWAVEKIDQRTGIHERHIAAPGECVSDLAAAAVRKLFAAGVCRADEIDYVLLCTESADYPLPATACILQDRLGIPTTAGALDFNLGSSGYVYGLGLAEGLISTGQASRVLLLTADVYSRYLHPRDRTVRPIFGDAAAATLITAVDTPEPLVGPFVYGTDGSGAENLIVPAGGMRSPRTAESAVATEDEGGSLRSRDNLFMNGAEIFTFTLKVVPPMVGALLERAGVRQDEVDLYVFHQANQYMLDHLRKRLKIPPEKFQVALADCGNTVSATIPIALHRAGAEGRLHSGALVMLVGFGVGYSWGATLVRWR